MRRTPAAVSWYFNPRSLAGATFGDATSGMTYDEFQSTLPCGSDAVADYSTRQPSDFNPRSLAGATAA